MYYYRNVKELLDAITESKCFKIVNEVFSITYSIGGDGTTETVISVEKEQQSKKNYMQLRGILEELENMMNRKCLALYYPRIIVDSWDYNDDLGLELLDLAELYKKWK